MTEPIAQPFAWLGADGFLNEMTRPYWLSFAVAMAVFGWAGLRKPAAAASVQRSGGDPTYFTSVLVWAYDTALRAYETLHWGHNSTASATMPWRLQALIAAAATLSLLIVCSLAAEAVARHRGRPARASGASVPLPVLAAIACGFGVWLMILAPGCWR